MGKEKLEKMLEKKLVNKQNIVAPYIMAGDGGLDKLEEHVLFLQDCGVTAIEIGIPFSDPVADGPIIQAAGERALKNGTTLAKVLETLLHFKQAPTVPIILMTYINLIYSYGMEEFAAACKEAKVNGVIIPDLPLEEEVLVSRSLQEQSIAFIRLVSLTSPRERLIQLMNQSEGFLYAVSVTGTTGSRNTYEKEVKSYLHMLKKHSQIPVLAGLGISTVKQAQELSACCDGVIIGSAIVQKLHEGKKDEVRKLIEGSL